MSNIWNTVTVASVNLQQFGVLLIYCYPFAFARKLAVGGSKTTHKRFRSHVHASAWLSSSARVEQFTQADI